LPEVKLSAYQRLEALAGEHLSRHRRAGDATTVANGWWATVHGVARLMIDGALPLSRAQAFALLDASLDAVLR
jgi:hypothetical protein